MGSPESNARPTYWISRARGEQTTIHPRVPAQPPQNTHTHSSEVDSPKSKFSHSVRDRFQGNPSKQAKPTPPPEDLLKCVEPELPENRWDSSSKETSLLAEEFIRNQHDLRYHRFTCSDRRAFLDRVEALLQNHADPNLTICKYEIGGSYYHRVLGLQCEENPSRSTYDRLDNKHVPDLLGRAASKPDERPRLTSLFTPFLESIVENDCAMIVLLLRYGVNARDLVRHFTLIEDRHGFEDFSALFSVSSRFQSTRDFVKNVNILQDTSLEGWLVDDLLRTLKTICKGLIVSHKSYDLFSLKLILKKEDRVLFSQRTPDLSDIVWTYSRELPTGGCPHLRDQIARVDEENSGVSASSVSAMCNMCQLVAGHRRLVIAYPVPRAVISLVLRHIQDTQKWELISHVTGTTNRRHTINAVPRMMTTIMNEMSSFEDRDTRSLAAVSNHWLIGCAKTHVTCQGIDPNYVPTRLVEILDEGTIRIVEHMSFPQKYATLSHRWSRDEASKTTSINIIERLSPFRADQLSPTLRDSIKISQRLGCRYLWIDMLCIIQDSEQDWRHEAAEMSHVYANAVITIASTCIDDEAAAGTLRLRDLRESRPFPLYELEEYAGQEWDTDIQSKEDSSDDALYIYPNVGGKQHANRPKGVLDTRGWILQEQLLSPRILYYGHQQLYWDCISQLASEIYPAGISLLDVNNSSETWAFRLLRRTIAGKGDPKRFAKLIADVWIHVVQNYSARTLTKQSDKLIALQGVITALEAVLQFPSVAGMWQQDLWKQLVWWVATPAIAANHVHSPFSAPTWSWLSVDGAVSHHHSMSLYKDPVQLDDLAPLPNLRCTITNIRAEPTSVSALLDLSATSFSYMLTANDLKEMSWKRGHPGKLNLAPGSWMLDRKLELPLKLQCVIIAEDEAAKMTVGMCLVANDFQPDTWKRVGVFLWEGLIWQITRYVGQELQTGHFAVI